MSSESKGWLSHFWRQYAKPFLFVAVVMIAFRSSIADWNDVPTGSMRPSILEGDRIFVNKLAYDLKVPYFTSIHTKPWATPQRGDVIVFFSPANGDRLVKRVVGVPGDVIQIRDGNLIVNGKAAQYAPLDSKIASQVEESKSNAFVVGEEVINGKKHPVIYHRVAPPEVESRWYGPITVPPDHYFAMGDNRDNSRDSRWIGMVPMDNIVGRASSVIMSLDTEHHYAPRWKRFFKALP